MSQSTTASKSQSPAPGIVSRRSRTPRILYLSPHWPHRATGASELRALNVARALQEFGDVEVVVVDGEGRAELGPRADHTLKIAYSVPVHLRPSSNVWRKLQWAFNPRSMYPHGCGVDDAAMQRVLESARQFDLIWFNKLRTPNMFPRWAWPRSVVDIDDVPSTFEHSILQNELSPQERFATFARFRSWRRRDRLLGERFTVLGVCSDAAPRDSERLRAAGDGACAESIDAATRWLHGHLRLSAECRRCPLVRQGVLAAHQARSARRAAAIGRPRYGRTIETGRARHRRAGVGI